MPATKPAKTSPAVKDFFAESLKLVESKSIREWATSKQNKPIWLKMAANAYNSGSEPVRFAAYMVCVAIGA